MDLCYRWQTICHANLLSVYALPVKRSHNSVILTALPPSFEVLCVWDQGFSRYQAMIQILHKIRYKGLRAAQHLTFTGSPLARPLEVVGSPQVRKKLPHTSWVDYMSMAEPGPFQPRSRLWYESLHQLAFRCQGCTTSNS